VTSIKICPPEVQFLASLPTIPTNTLTANGLTLVSQADWNTYFTAVFQALYGSDIVLTQDTPDGQLIGIIIQAILDNQDLVQQVYSSFDPTQAIGTALDSRLGLVGIVRLAGTYSLVNVTVTTTQPVQLYGLDQTAQPVYTLSDSNGNQWQLLNSITTSQGANVGIVFQASLPGPTTTTVSSITTQVTGVVGVSSVTNPQAPYQIGTAEESDVSAKIRLAQSRQAFFTSLYTALSNVSGITSINIQENDTSENDSEIPNTGTASSSNAHSIWVVVGGNASASSIANAIYQNRNAGCGMVGSTSAIVTRPDGSTFTVYWDVVALSDLYIEMWLTSIDGVTPPAVASVAEQLSTSSSYQYTATWSSAATSMTINATVGGDSVSSIAVGQLVQGTGIPDNTFVTGVSTVASTTTVTFSNAATAPGSTSAVTFYTSGLLVPGIGSTLNINQVATLVQQIDSNSLVSWSGNTYTGGIQNVAPGGSYSQSNYKNVIMPGNPSSYTAQQQPTLIPGRTIVYPMIISPASSSPNSTYVVSVSGSNVNTTINVIKSDTQQFAVAGGYNAWTYSLTTNNSGGSCTSDGLYTAGSTANVTDVVTVTDTTGVTAVINISVVT
jgi:hypothetical protein